MKKAQSALEFLTTYGWAFMVILIAIGSLAHFGFLKPTPPSKCMISPEFACHDYKLEIDNINSKAIVTLIISNSKDFTMNISHARITLPNSKESGEFRLYRLANYVPPYDTNNDSIDFVPGEKRYIRWVAEDDGGFQIQEKAKVLFRISYKNQDIDGFVHTINGEVIAEVNSI